MVDVQARLEKQNAENEYLKKRISSLRVQDGDKTGKDTLVAEGYSKAEADADPYKPRLGTYATDVFDDLEKATKEMARAKPKDPAVEKRLKDLILKAEKIKKENRLDQKRESEIYRSLGYIYSMSDDPDKAIVFYDKALLLNPKDKDVCYNLGYLYTQKGEYDKAVECYKNALSGAETDKDIYYNLAVIFNQYLDDEILSKAYYDKYLEY